MSVCSVGPVTIETIVRRSTVRRCFGGATYYFSVALASLGVPTRIVTRICGELENLKTELRRFGIEIVALPCSREARCTIRYVENRREIIFEYPPEPMDLNCYEYCSGATYIHIAPLTKNDVPPKSIELAKNRGYTVVLDVQGLLRSVEKNGFVKLGKYVDIEELSRYVDILKLDDSEGEILTGFREPTKILDTLASYFREIVLTTDEGVFVRIGNETRFAPFLVEEIVGRTGRGDTALAAYIYAKIAGMDPDMATNFVAAVTSIKLSMEGPFTEDLSTVVKMLSEVYGVELR